MYMYLRSVQDLLKAFYCFNFGDAFVTIKSILAHIHVGLYVVHVHVYCSREKVANPIAELEFVPLQSSCYVHILAYL